VPCCRFQQDEIARPHDDRFASERAGTQKAPLMVLQIDARSLSVGLNTRSSPNHAVDAAREPGQRRVYRKSHASFRQRNGPLPALSRQPCGRTIRDKLSSNSFANFNGLQSDAGKSERLARSFPTFETEATKKCILATLINKERSGSLLGRRPNRTDRNSILRRRYW